MGGLRVRRQRRLSPLDVLGRCLQWISLRSSTLGKIVGSTVNRADTLVQSTGAAGGLHGGAQPCVRSNSCMKETSASTPSSGMAL